MIKAAGLMLLTKAGETLLLCRAPGQSHEAEYCFPGGQIEGAETAEAAACRECKEEVGFLPEGERVLWTRRIAEDVDYTTFIQRIDEPFVPTLSAEHTGFLWAATESLLGDGVAAADSDVLPVFIPPRVRLTRHDLLPGREDEAGYFEPDDDFGKGDGSGQIAVANKVKVGDSYRTLAEPGRVLAHEAGHAIDHAMGHPSKGLSLPAPGARETAWEAVGARYYLADHDEFWAESCAVQTGPPKAMYFGGMTRARALELFGAEIGQVTEAVASWRISSV